WESGDFGARRGALAGAAAGAVFGAIFPPSLLVSSAIGAGLGGIVAHFRDKGFSNEELNRLRDAMGPNSSALVVMVEHEWAGQVREAFAGSAVASSGRTFDLTQQWNDAVKAAQASPTPRTEHD